MLRWIESSLGDFKLPEVLFMKEDNKLLASDAKEEYF
jgi:hypothetical protein